MVALVPGLVLEILCSVWSFYHAKKGVIRHRFLEEESLNAQVLQIPLLLCHTAVYLSCNYESPKNCEHVVLSKPLMASIGLRSPSRMMTMMVLPTFP